jgi:hypothetical protein
VIGFEKDILKYEPKGNVCLGRPCEMIEISVL